MTRHRKATQAGRKRALSRFRKLRGSLRGHASTLEYLLKERRRELEKEEKRFKK